MANGLVRHGRPAVVPDATATGEAVNQGQLTSGLAGKANTSHSHAAADVTSGQFSNSRMPQVMSPVLSGGPGSGTIATDASNVGNNRNYTANGNITIAVPTNGADGQVIQYAVLASGGARTITFNASLRRLTGIAAGPTSIPSGQVCRFSLRYCALLTAWIVEAFGITQ